MKQDSIRAHLFIAVLAYHVVHLLRTLLQRQGTHSSWARIGDLLSCWMQTTTTLIAVEGELINIRQDPPPADAGDAGVEAP